MTAPQQAPILDGSAKEIPEERLRLKDAPVCPHCGHVEKDAWEIDFGGVEGSTQHSCGECGMEYDVFREATFYYTTSKVSK